MGGSLRMLLVLIAVVGALTVSPVKGPPVRVPHEFEGQPLRYLIGANDFVWQDRSGVLEVGYDADSCPPDVLAAYAIPFSLAYLGLAGLSPPNGVHAISSLL
jgi:hypothetical protein